MRHDIDGPGSAAVIHLQFLVNEGALISATADDTLHLWNFRQKIPQIVQSLKFQKERLVYLAKQKKYISSIYLFSQSYFYESSFTIKMVIYWYRTRKCTCRANRKFSFVRLCDQLE